jgi:cytochrome c biogenesis factor
MSNIFLIIPVSCLAYLLFNLYLYKRSKQADTIKFNPQKNLLFYGIIFLIIISFQALNIFNFISDNFSYNNVYQHSEKSIL